jgi:Spy/CpxP family protein refolding chaperone
MKKLNTIGLTAILMIAITAVAFAYDGDDSPMGGYGGHHMMEPGYGRHMMEPGYGRYMMGNDGDCGSYMRGDRRWGHLSDRDIAKLDASREKFYNDTRELRSKIDEKQGELNHAMNQDNPDQSKIFELQKQVSSLQSDFDQKVVAHRLEMRKLLPDNFRASGVDDGYCW